VEHAGSILQSSRFEARYTWKKSSEGAQGRPTMNSENAGGNSPELRKRHAKLGELESESGKRNPAKAYSRGKSKTKEPGLRGKTHTERKMVKGEKGGRISQNPCQKELERNGVHGRKAKECEGPRILMNGKFSTRGGE